MAREQCSRKSLSHNLTVRKASVSLGSNRSDGLERVMNAIKVLARVYDVMDYTPPFVTPDIHAALLNPPVLFPRPYTNAVAIIVMPRPPLADASCDGMNRAMKALEKVLGRSAEEKARGLVSIDLDIVTSERKILRQADYLRPYYFPRALTLPGDDDK